MKLWKKLIFAIAKFFILVMLVNSALVLFAYADTVKIVEYKIQDLAQLVTLSNGLPRDDSAPGVSSSYDVFRESLAESETQFTRFSDTFGKDSKLDKDNVWGTIGDTSKIADWAFEVRQGNANGKPIYSLEDTVQRGQPIYIKVTAKINVPFLAAPNRDLGRMFDIQVSKDFVVLGHKFYKSK